MTKSFSYPTNSSRLENIPKESGNERMRSNFSQVLMMLHVQTKEVKKELYMLHVTFKEVSIKQLATR